MLIGKRVVEFLLVIIELFCWVLWLRRYERKSIVDRRFRRNEVSLAQKLRYKGSFPTPITILPVTKLDELSFYMV